MTGALLLLSSCSVTVPDFKACSPIPGVSADRCEITNNPVPGLLATCQINRGAACDNFLSSAPVLLDANGWTSQIQAWISQGLATECTDSGSLSNIKKAIEELCSKFPCTEGQAQAVQAISTGLGQMLATGARAHGALLQ